MLFFQLDKYGFLKPMHDVVRGESIILLMNTGMFIIQMLIIQKK